MVDLCVHQVTHFTPEAHGQLGGVAGLDDLLAGFFTEEPSRKQI